MLNFGITPGKWNEGDAGSNMGPMGPTHTLSHAQKVYKHILFALPTSLTITNVQYLQYTMTNAILCGSVIFLPSTCSLNTLKVFNNHLLRIQKTHVYVLS